MGDVLYDLRSVVSMEGQTFSSAEVIGICSRAYTEIERLRAALEEIANDTDEEATGLAARKALNIQQHGGER